jgi:hypothetical protein
MKKRDNHAVWCMVGALVILFQLSTPGVDGICAVPNTTGDETVQKAFTVQIPFIANTGQADSQAAYIARTFGGALFVTRQGQLVYALSKSLAPHSALI